MSFSCFKRSMKQTVHLSDRTRLRAIVFEKISRNRSGEGHNFFTYGRGRVTIFLLVFNKYVYNVNNDTSVICFYNHAHYGITRVP